MTYNPVFGIDTAAALFDIHAKQRPDAVAFIEYDDAGRETRTTYADGKAIVDDIASALVAAGVGSGDRVAVRLPKSVRNILLFFAVARAGGIYTPINPDFTDREAGVLIEDSDPKLLIDNCTGEVERSEGADWTRLRFGSGGSDDLMTLSGGDLPPLPAADQGALMLFTSGTTGRPKGAMLTHANLLSNVAALSDAWGITENDRLLHVLPVYHGHGLYLGVAMPLLRGSSIIFLPKFDAARVLELMPEASMFMAVPAIWTRLLDHPEFGVETCRNLRLATSGSAPLSPEIFEALNARIGKQVIERYGMTETCMLTTNPIDGSARVGSVGKALPCIDLRIVGSDGAPLPADEVGSVQVRGDSIIAEYWRRLDKKDDWTADGWFDTGDLARLDEDGYLWIVGRRKELIITGGYNVYPREVEIQIEAFPGVAEAVVFGVPHPDFGEGVMAAVKCEPGQTPDVDALSAFLAGCLAKYKQPKKIVLRDEFPRNLMGKILKVELQSEYCSTFA